MRFHHWRFLIVFAVWVSSWHGATGQTKEDIAFRSTIAKATNSSEAGKAYLAWFTQLGPVGVKRLMTDSDLSIALRAIWETAHTHPDGQTRVQAFDEFLKHLEKRTKVLVPPKWEAGLPELFQRSLSEGAQREKTRTDIVVQARKFTSSPLGFWLPQGITVSREGNKLIFKGQHVNLEIDEPEVQNVKKKYLLGDNICINVIFGAAPNRSFLYVYDQFGGRYVLFCIDSRSQKIVWRNIVWAAGFENVAGFAGAVGADSHQQIIVLASDKIIIFGRASTESYAEGFEVGNGTVLFRFSSNCWYVR
jgi:hypothetical protein